MNKKPKKIICSTKERDVMIQLVRKGFEVLGTASKGNITGRNLFSMRGEERLINDREWPYIRKMGFREEGKGEIMQWQKE